MARADQLHAAIEAHVAAVGAGDATTLETLHAQTAGYTTRPALSPSWAAPLEIVTIFVTRHDAAVHFRATPAGSETRDVIDTMIFDDQQ